MNALNEKRLSLAKKMLKLLGNFSYRITGDIIAKLLSLVTVPIIARALKPEAFGVWDLVQIIINYSVILVNFGFIQYGLREVARSDNPSRIVNRIFNARLTLAMVSIVLSGLVVFTVYHNNMKLAIAVFMGYGIIIASAINTDFYFFGKKNLLLPTLSHLAGQLIFVAGVFLFVNRPESLFILIIFYSIYYLSNAIILLFIYLRKNTLKIKISIQETWDILKQTYRLGLSTKFDLLQSSFPKFLISAMLGNYLLGIYSAAFKFYTIILLVYQGIMLGLGPYIVKLHKESFNRQIKYTRLSMGLIIAAGIGAASLSYLFGEFLVDVLFGKDFGATKPVFRMICFFMIPVKPVYMLLGSILVYFNQEKKFLASTIINALIIVIVSPFLIHFYELKGAVIAFFLSDFGTIIFMLYHVNKIIPGVFVPLARKG